MTKTASFGKTLVFPNNVIPRQGGRAMMMAQNATNGKLEKLLGAAADLFDFVQRLAEEGRRFTKSRRAFGEECFKWGTKLSASSSTVRETGIWARR